MVGTLDSPIKSYLSLLIGLRGGLLSSTYYMRHFMILNKSFALYTKQ